MNQTSKLKVGEMLIQEGFLTPEQLNQALTVQKSQKVYKPVGEICVELKFLSRRQLNKVLNKYQKRIRIGDLLINLGLITPEQLQEALRKQKEEGGKLGTILVNMGSITETALINTLTIQMGVPKIIPDFHLIDKKLLEGIGQEFLMKHRVLPAFKEENVLTVIMSNPLDEETVRLLGQTFKCKIEPAIATTKDIKKAIEEHYQEGELSLQAVLGEDKKDLVIGDTDFSTDSGDNVVSILDYIITNAIMEGASDIHIEPKEKALQVRYRVDGILKHKTDLPISLAPNIVSRIKAVCRLDIAEKRRHQDGRIEARIKDREVDLRISVYASVYGENVVIRVLHRKSELIELDSLGISPANMSRYRQILDQPSGIILATGPTGSGKTTTLYASLNYLNDGEKSIITVEDPVEYTIEGVVQGQLNPKLGHTYVDFLKAMMRQDPDVIMVGEIRENASAEAVIQAALTGHKVLSTFHTDDTTGALLRLMDMGIDTFLISSTVVSVIAQRLVRVLCPGCREPYVPEKHLLTSFNVSSMDSDRVTFYRPVGCSRCGDSGFKGRTAIHELMFVNDAIREAILSRKTSTQIRLIAREKAKLISMREDGFYKATQGVTSLEEVLRVVFHNESDELSSRSAEEIVSNCEEVTTVATTQPEEIPIPQKVPVEEAEGQVFTAEGDVSPLEGEVYRVRLDVTTIEGETEEIIDFFNIYKEIMDKMGKSLDPELLTDFVDFVIYTVKRLEISIKAEFVEFYVRVEKGEVKIKLETFIPESRPAYSSFHTSKETGLRLINFLMPPLGVERALTTESGYMKRGGPYRSGRASLVGYLKQGSEPKPDERVMGLDDFTAKGSVIYKKHVEELAWEGQPVE